MESIGQILRAQREKRGLSLADVHDSTKITPQNLEALEQDRFDYFPNRVYARAFLRDYANFLGLDSARLLSDYEAEWTLAAPVAEKKDKKQKEPSGAGSSRRMLVPLAGAVVLLLLLTAGYFGYTALGNRHDRPSAEQTTTAQHQEEQAEPVQPQPEAPTTPEPENVVPPIPEPEPQPEPAAPQPADKLALTVSARTGVWIIVKTDNTVAFQGTLPKGSVKTFEGAKTIYIRSGMAGALDLKLNGKSVQPLGPMGQVGSRTFKLSDTQQQPTAPSSQSTTNSPSGAGRSGGGQ